jgi:peptide/nickel transport system substrate-binding protein
MEGHGNSALPEEKSSKKGSSGKIKLIAIVVVVILVISAIGAVLLMGGEKDETSVSFSANTESIVAGETVIFNASASVGPNGKTDSLTGYVWQFGDGATSTKTVDTVSHIYQYPGKYIVLLTITDDDDKQTTDLENYLIIEVSNPTAPLTWNEVDEYWELTPNNDTSPVAIVSASNNVVSNGTEIDFDASLSSAYVGDITNFTWTFGLGSNVVGNVTEAGAVSKTYTGDEGVLYATYVEITTSTGASQRYYNSVLIVPEGGTTGDAKIFVRETIGGDPDGLDPAVDYETSGGEVLQNVYETLIWYDGASAVDLVPVLATEVPTYANGGISADGLTYIFNLREGVVMQDGTIMDANDVEYSLERVLTINNPNGPAWMLGQVMVSNFTYGGELDATEIANSVEITGPMQVTIHLLKPYPAFIYVMAYTEASIVSKEFVEAHGGVVVNTDNEYMRTHCCGSGPYKMDVWSPGIQIVLKRHDSYWQTPAALQVIVIKGVPDFGARLIHLKAGTADSIQVPRKNIAAMAGVENVIISQGNETLALDFIGMNLNITDPSESGIDIGDIPLDFFSDVNVRRAFAYAFNYSLNIAVNYVGTAVQPNGPIPDGMLGHDSSIPTWDFNLSMAAECLDAAINPATGNSWLDDGFTINVYYNSENTVRKGACTILEQGLESLSTNINVIPTGKTWSVYLGLLYDGALPTFVLGWSVDYADPDDFVQPFMKDGSTYGGPMAFDNDTLSQMVDDAAMELNATARFALYHDIQQSSYDNCLYIWLAQATNYAVMRDWVTGFNFNPMYAGLYYYDLDIV